MAKDEPHHPSDRDLRSANARGRAGPGGYAGGNSDRAVRTDAILRGQQHMSGRYGGKAFGRSDGVTSNIPRDLSQHNGPVATSGGAPSAGSGQNAQISSGSPAPAIGSGRENERDAPGISTDKRSDDTKP